ncbi:hypothetical protein HK102_012778, partial [Quaeritorhiza haematococci]
MTIQNDLMEYQHPQPHTLNIAARQAAALAFLATIRLNPTEPLPFDTSYSSSTTTTLHRASKGKWRRNGDPLRLTSIKILGNANGDERDRERGVGKLSASSSSGSQISPSKYTFFAQQQQGQGQGISAHSLIIPTQYSINEFTEIEEERAAETQEDISTTNTNKNGGLTQLRELDSNNPNTDITTPTPRTLDRVWAPKERAAIGFLNSISVDSPLGTSSSRFHSRSVFGASLNGGGGAGASAA